jgi:hypothetical protein
MDINQLNRAYAEQYAKDHKLEERYTAPRELSDEEIMNIAFCSEVSTVAIENDWNGTVIEFAKAILKKASER